MNDASSETTSSALLPKESVQLHSSKLGELKEALGQILFGQDEMLELVVVALAARGHVLLEGLPGLGKTELVKGIGHLLGLEFRRVQFTPDLLPSDITGGSVLEDRDGHRSFRFQKGPLFAHIVLADEINRASPKTQSALLEAMQERRVTVLGETHDLPLPFFVLATQNPIELEGTYPLPEAQLDRFLFKIEVESVGPEVLTRILTERRRGEAPEPSALLDAAGLAELFEAIDQVFLPNAVADYIARIVSASHSEAEGAPDWVKEYIRHGASPRAAISIAEAGRARALLHGRPNVDFDDVDAVATSALGHRIVLEHKARIDGLSARELVKRLIAATDAVGAGLPGGLS